MSLPALAGAVAAADCALRAAVATPSGPPAGSVILVACTMLAGLAGTIVGATGALRGRRRDIGTLRALGWPAASLRLRLRRSFALLGLLAGAGAAALAWAGQALAGGGWAPGPAAAAWRLACVPAACLIVAAGAWWPARKVATQGAGPGSALSRRLLKGVMIAGAGMAVSLPLAARWAWSPSPAASSPVPSGPAPAGLALPGLASSGPLSPGPLPSGPGWPGLGWPGLGAPGALPWAASAADWAAVVAIVVLAAGTVADLGWLAARERAGESRTLRAMGWPARGLVTAAAADAVLLGLAGGVAAGVLDVAGALAVAHRMPHRMVAVIGITVAAGVAISLLA
ncbi:MAG TPA: hypothetical protein VH478_24635, partial [Trebonia sp.]|nr:hypothetical protein [Trebonia sp.]